MSGPLAAPLVVISGAARGIGLATARAYAARGARVVACDLRDTHPVREALGAALVEAQEFDLTDAEACRAFGDAVVTRHGAPDVVISNAGVGLAGSFARVSATDFDQVVRVNLLGAANFARAFVPALLNAGRGQIVFVVSALGYFPAPGMSAYVASKHGLLGLSQSLRAELGPRGIGVSAVCPAVVSTALIDEAPIHTGDAGLPARVRAMFKRRAMSAEAVAQAILDTADRNRAVSTPSTEALALWWLRGSPEGTVRFARWLLRRARRR